MSMAPTVRPLAAAFHPSSLKLLCVLLELPCVLLKLICALLELHCVLWTYLVVFGPTCGVWNYIVFFGLALWSPIP
jgi:hypothetical protein